MYLRRRRYSKSSLYSTLRAPPSWASCNQFSIHIRPPFSSRYCNTIKNVRLQILTLQHINQSRTCLENRRPAANDRKLLGPLGQYWRYTSFIDRYTQSTGCCLQALSILATEALSNAKKNAEDYGSRSAHRSAANTARHQHPYTATFIILFLPVGDCL